MSKEINAPQNNSEEVDLIGLFKLFGRAITSFFSVIGSIFKSVFSIIVYAIKAVIDNIKTISIVVVLFAICGYGIEKIDTNRYSSRMLVKPYFDSKYQLISNIDYFNSLISNQDYVKLSDIFKITQEEAKTIIGFEIEAGPESKNEKMQQYSNFLKTIDSVMAQDVSFDDFIDNRDIYAFTIYGITVSSTKVDIFKRLEDGLNTSFENTYSEKKKKKRDSLIYIERRNILVSISSVDSLQKVYIDVLKEESSSNSNKISLGEGFTLEPDKSKTKEFELLNKGIDLRNELTQLDQQKVLEDEFFDAISGFQEIGSISKSFTKRYTIVLPILAFILLCFLFITNKIIKFVKSYA